jgi:cobalamin biosynthesis protein CobT
MTNKRSLPAISRNSDESTVQPSWMSDYANRLSKQSVQPYRQDNSVYDQIYSIINGNKPKYPSVDAAVKDMQERSGFSAYQTKQKSASNEDQMKAMAAQICRKAEEKEDKKDDTRSEVRLFKLHPQIKSTIDNWIEEVHGNLPVPAVITRIKEIHRNDVSDDSAWDEDDLIHYVSDKCHEVESRYPSDKDSGASLGHLPHFTEDEIDPSNRDALFCLNPVALK